MNVCDIKMQEIIARMNRCDVVEGATRILTTCMLPDGSAISLYVYKKEKDKYVVTDDGVAFDFLIANGYSLNRSSTRHANNHAERFFLSFDSVTKSFFSDPVDINQVQAALMYMANLVQKFTFDSYERIYEENKIKLDDQIIGILKANKKIPKHTIVTDYSVAGESNKIFHFSCGLIISEKKILIEGVNNHPSSISSAYTLA